jgi:hypothetical protein
VPPSRPILAQVVVCAPSGCHQIEREELLWYALDGEWLQDLPRTVPGS